MAILGDFIVMCHEAAFDIPTKTFDAVSGKQEGELFDDFGDLFITYIYKISGQEAENLLLDERSFIAVHVIYMELLAPRKDFAFHIVAIIAVDVLDGEFIAPCKYFLFNIKLHLIKSPVVVLGYRFLKRNGIAPAINAKTKDAVVLINAIWRRLLKKYSIGPASNLIRIPGIAKQMIR